eukprot:289382-Chlamydomonas_euryale.AAC.7
MRTHLRVVGRADAVHVAGDLRAQVGDADELLQEVLGHHVRVAGVADVVRVDVDMVHSQVEVGGGDGADTPFRLGAKRRLLVRRRCRDDHVVAVHVGRLGRDGGHLAALARLLLDLGNLLPLLRWRRDLRAQDDVADLGLRQRLYVDVVLLCVVSKDQVLQRNLDPGAARGHGASGRVADGSSACDHCLGPCTSGHTLCEGFPSFLAEEVLALGKSSGNAFHEDMFSKDHGPAADSMPPLPRPTCHCPTSLPAQPLPLPAARCHACSRACPRDSSHSLDPLLVREARPHVVRLRDNRLVRPQDHARLLWVDVQRAQDEDDARERRVGRHGAQPVVVQ